MITYIIVDDEHIAHDIIKNYCDMLPNLEFKTEGDPKTGHYS